MDLPKHRPSPTDTPATAATSPSPAKPPLLPRLLLVEDDATSRRALQTLLGRHGWTVHSATTVAEAQKLLAAGGIAAIVLDLMLPDGDGLTILKQAQQLGLAPRVVVATGAGDESYLDAARAYSPAAVLKKPIRLPDLLAALPKDT